MSDFVIENDVLKKYVGPGGDVVIPEGVTKIGYGVFGGRCDLTTVTIPNGVTAIDDWEFSGCTSLTAVTIPNSVTTIGYRAFSGCESLTAVTIPDNVTSIGSEAFRGCNALADEQGFVVVRGTLFDYVGNASDITIPDHVTSISTRAFYENATLTRLILSDGIASIPDQAFCYCKKLTTLTIPGSVTTIGREAFYNCENLASITIPDSVTSIGSGAFSGCKALADEQGFVIVRNVLYQYYGHASAVSIPSNITTIGSYAFHWRKELASVTISDSVTSIERKAFHHCVSLTTITIPANVTDIGEYAFQDCWNLSTVIIPDRVTSIANNTFDGCRRIAKLKLPVSLGATVGKQLTYKDDLRIDIADLSALPAKVRICAALCYAEDGGEAADPRYESHGKYLKANSGKLVETAMKNHDLLALLCREGWIKAKDIEAYVDAAQKTGDAEKIAMVLECQNSKLTKKQKENVVKQKEKQENTVFDRAIARMNQVGIAGLNFVVTGDLETFQSRKELKTFIENQGGKLVSSLSSKTDYLIMNDAESDTEKKKKAEALGIDIITETQFNDKSGWAFVIEDGTLTKYQGAGGDVVIPDGVTSIGAQAFSYCEKLTSVTLPANLTKIDSYAFSWCKELASINIPDSVTLIGDGAFCGCESLADEQGFMIVRDVLYGYFGKASALTVPNDVISISSDAFWGNNQLTIVTIPDSVTSIGDSAFFSCENLTSVTVPGSVTSIGRKAFLLSKNAVIHGKAGSHAEAYAKKNNIPFVADLDA